MHVGAHCKVKDRDDREENDGEKRNGRTYTAAVPRKRSNFGPSFFFAGVSLFRHFPGREKKEMPD